MTITLTVAGRIATVEADGHVVAGNTYPVTLALDSEWTGDLYLRVRFGSLYYDIPFASTATSVDVQFPVGYPEVGIGVFSEALEICTNEARVRLLRSILEAGEQVVEFDSDLYDQWAGEVTTLLTDDAFDAESTRPVQNAVITAWKDTVPLDSALVHKTGTETVDGYKTFLQSPVVSRASPGLTLTTTRTPADTGEKFTINGFAGSELRGKVCQIRNASDEYIALRQYKVDGTSGYYDFRIRTDSSGNGWAEAPTYTADNNADTKVVTRAMLVATPTVVHTTGTETVAGAKTFTSLLTASNVQVKDASTPTVTMLKGSDEVASLASDGTQAGITASSQFFGLRGLGTAPFGQAPSYTADNSADGKIVTRAMLAQSPTVVHTTGAETVAGVKTFQNGIEAYPTGWHSIGKSGMTVGQYSIFAEVTATNSQGRFVTLDFTQSSNTLPCMGRLMLQCLANPPSTSPKPIWVYRKAWSGVNNPLSSNSIVMLYKDGHLYLAWYKEYVYGSAMARVALDINYGSIQSVSSSAIQFFASADMTILDNLDGYTVYEVTE